MTRCIISNPSFGGFVEARRRPRRRHPHKRRIHPTGRDCIASTMCTAQEHRLSAWRYGQGNGQLQTSPSATQERQAHYALSLQGVVQLETITFLTATALQHCKLSMRRAGMRPRQRRRVGRGRSPSREATARARARLYSVYRLLTLSFHLQFTV